jgi:hypothetical protein
VSSADSVSLDLNRHTVDGDLQDACPGEHQVTSGSTTAPATRGHSPWPTWSGISPRQ